MELHHGQEAPGFELKDQPGQEVALQSLRGEKAVVLVFYPYAFSRVCSGELAALHEARAKLVSDDVALLAVSCDPMFALRAFADQMDLDFPLLSDFWPHGAVAEAYGVFDAERGCAKRSSFVIDPEGVVRWSVHNAMPDARHIDDHIRALDEVLGR